VTAKAKNGLLAAATIALGPLLLCQGAYVRCATPKLPEAEGLREGLAGEGDLLRLLVLGDSAAAGVGVSSQEEALAGHTAAGLRGKFQVQWKLEAKTGATTRSTVQRIGEMSGEEFHVVVVSLGVNDVTSGRRLSTWLAGIDELADLLRVKFGARFILFSGLPPMHHFPALPQPLRWYLGARARMFDRGLQLWALTQPDCEHMPPPDSSYAGMMAADGFHPGPAMYALWGAEAARRITLRTTSAAAASEA
jgi:lysophospholipase L1-like esterase